jgi:uncharacterized protein Yka (UPF0111/DUF47 family)
MRRRRWFLPAVPDLLGTLRAQVAITVEGLEAFAAWAAGDAAAAEAVRACEHRADKVKAQLHQALRQAFVTPLEPEDLFALSQGIDSVLNQAKDTAGEAEVMACAPDAAMAEMAADLAGATHHLADAVGLLGHGDPFPAAAAAIKTRRRLEHVYRREMAALLESADLRREIEMRELYRRCSRIGDAIVDVAERIQYASVKEG